jgi:glycerophosphoryl diester phosphodiesterase
MGSNLCDAGDSHTSGVSFPFLEYGGPIAMAHRGGAKHPDNLGYENSMRAFGHAAGLGYRYLETDVHATSDGVVLAFHDSSLDRVTDRSGLIADLPWSEVSQARIGGREPIPRLIDVLEEWPEVRLNLDVKRANAIGPVTDLLRRAGALDRVCVSSFSQQRIDAVRRILGPGPCTGLGVREVAAMKFCGRRGVGACLQIPDRVGPVRVLTPRLLRRAHAAGKQVHVWTIDDPARMRRLLDAGVDGIITDRTDLLRDVLIERGQWVAA